MYIEQMQNMKLKNIFGSELNNLCHQLENLCLILTGF